MSKDNNWLKKNGYNEKRLTYVYFPADSYEVKDQLKDAGFKFDKTLLWHAPQIIEGYEDKVIEIWFDALGTMTTWGEGFYAPDAKRKVMDRIMEMRPEVEHKSNWVGEPKEKITFDAIVTYKRGMVTMYGSTNLIKFEDNDNNIYQWWSNSAGAIGLEQGDKVTITGTVKSHDEYMGDKITTLTRCKVM